MNWINLKSKNWKRTWNVLIADWDKFWSEVYLLLLLFLEFCLSIFLHLPSDVIRNLPCNFQHLEFSEKNLEKSWLAMLCFRFFAIYSAIIRIIQIQFSWTNVSIIWGKHSIFLLFQNLHFSTFDFRIFCSHISVSVLSLVLLINFKTSTFLLEFLK